MSTTEDFENAPIGATASSTETNARYIKSSDRWLLFDGRGDWRGDEFDLESGGFMLDPTDPTTAREALDLAWELAHPVKEWQVIPKGARYLVRNNGGVIKECTAGRITSISHGMRNSVRTLDPLSGPEPEPDWLDAPAVFARPKNDDRHASLALFEQIGRGTLEDKRGNRFDWRELVDVTPLYPKEGQEA